MGVHDGGKATIRVAGTFVAVLAADKGDVGDGAWGVGDVGVADVQPANTPISKRIMMPPKRVSTFFRGGSLLLVLGVDVPCGASRWGGVHEGVRRRLKRFFPARTKRLRKKSRRGLTRSPFLEQG